LIVGVHLNASPTLETVALANIRPAEISPERVIWTHFVVKAGQFRFELEESAFVVTPQEVIHIQPTQG
jgi:hypothetical protein